VTFRPAEHADGEAIADLIRAYDGAHGGEIETDADEVRDDWTAPGFDLARDTLVAERDGRLVAYGWVAPRPAEGEIALDGYVHPDVPDGALGADLYGRMERRAAELGATRLVTGLGGEDVWGARLLSSLGWTYVRSLYRMAIDLDGPPPAPVWPEDVGPRPFRRGEEAVFHATISEAFADDPTYGRRSTSRSGRSPSRRNDQSAPSWASPPEPAPSSTCWGSCPRGGGAVSASRSFAMRSRRFTSAAARTSRCTSTRTTRPAPRGSTRPPGCTRRTGSTAGRSLPDSL